MDGVVVAGLRVVEPHDHTKPGLGIGDGLGGGVMLLPRPLPGGHLHPGLGEDLLVDEAGDGVVVLRDAVLLALHRVEIHQRLRVLVPGDVLEVVDLGEHPIGGVELDVGSVHPEHVGQLVALGLGAQLGPVLLVGCHRGSDRDVRILLGESLDVGLDGGSLVLVPVEQGQLSLGVLVQLLAGFLLSSTGRQGGRRSEHRGGCQKGATLHRILSF